VTAPAETDPQDPQATLELAWRSASVSGTFAPRFVHAFGLVAVAARRAGRIEEVDGSPILDGGIFAFEISSNTVTDLDETIDLILVVDRSVERFLVGWDANASPFNATLVEIPDGKDRWATVVVPLERARFAGRGPRGTDGGGGARGC
jgi:hypothetical protein